MGQILNSAPGRGVFAAEDTCSDEMGRGDFRQLEEFSVGEGKVTDHCDLVSAWLITLGTGERFHLHNFLNSSPKKFRKLFLSYLVDLTCGMRGSNIL